MTLASIGLTHLALTRVAHAVGLVWADLEEPQIYHLCFYIFAVGPKPQSAHEWDL